MYHQFFSEFLSGGDTLRVYQGEHLTFSSNKDRLLALLEYITRFVPQRQPVVIFDKPAIKTLDKYDIKYHISEIVSYIQKPDEPDMCPMEKLSLDKEPEEFYQVMKDTIKEQEGKSWR
ncbi:MAG: DUF1893 domain-containing protein [Chloroflexi bacterium]|nr:DUF1893 domain-containing protein [Chloroflexota bacterium]